MTDDSYTDDEQETADEPRSHAPDGAPRGDETRPDEPGILSPDELAIADDERVRPIGEDRYVVATDDDPAAEGRGPSGPTQGGGDSDPTAAGPDATAEGPDATAERPPSTNAQAPPAGDRPNAATTDDAARTNETADDVVRALADAADAYGVEIAVKTDRGVAAESFRSNDIRAVVAELLRWYAGRLDDETPPEEVLAIVLDAADLGLDVAVSAEDAGPNGDPGVE